MSYYISEDWSEFCRRSSIDGMLLAMDPNPDSAGMMFSTYDAEPAGLLYFDGTPSEELVAWLVCEAMRWLLLDDGSISREAMSAPGFDARLLHFLQAADQHQREVLALRDTRQHANEEAWRWYFDMRARLGGCGYVREGVRGE